MIVLDHGDSRFNYRVVGVAVQAGRVLLHRVEGDDFWSLPGGRAEVLEPARNTLRREMQEELGVDVRVDRLLWIVENFFTCAGRSYHELGLYFAMRLPPGTPGPATNVPFTGKEDGTSLIFQWHSLHDVAHLPVYPTFLREALKSLPASPEHIVHTDP